jgi:hypothetical protein
LDAEPKYLLCFTNSFAALGMQCWLKKQKDVMAPAVIAKGEDVMWTSGLIFGKGEVGYMQSLFQLTSCNSISEDLGNILSAPWTCLILLESGGGIGGGRSH